MEETLDHDLDAILGELNALENNFSDGDPDISRDSDTSSKASKASSTISTASTVVQVVRPSTAALPLDTAHFGITPDKPLANHLKPHTQGKILIFVDKVTILCYDLFYHKINETSFLFNFEWSHDTRNWLN